MDAPTASEPQGDAAILALVRPHQNLLGLYIAYSLAGFVFAPVVFVPLYFKYHTLRYRLDEEGISVSWGILFRREVHLTYKRIQDIHVKRNLIERWLGIATIEVETASGSASAELALEGIADWEGTRDFLYRRMRGHATAHEAREDGAPQSPAADEVVELLREIRAEVEGARRAIAARK